MQAKYTFQQSVYRVNIELAKRTCCLVHAARRDVDDARAVHAGATGQSDELVLVERQELKVCTMTSQSCQPFP